MFAQQYNERSLRKIELLVLTEMIYFHCLVAVPEIPVIEFYQISVSYRRHITTFANHFFKLVHRMINLKSSKN